MSRTRATHASLMETLMTLSFPRPCGFFAERAVEAARLAEPDRLHPCPARLEPSA
jgi:hypothetical protein